MSGEHDHRKTHCDTRAAERDAGCHDWAVVLAAGEGTRLRALTTTASGIAIPKQFCSLGGGQSLLHDALRRAQSVVSPARTCVVVAQQHRRWWQALPLNIPSQNVMSQPSNRGTANGILLPLLHVIERDPNATLLFLPSDHWVRHEDVLVSSLGRALTEAQQNRDHLLLLGMTPEEEPDPELGYIVPGEMDCGGISLVKQFVEKPSSSAARNLIARGGLWNSFIFAADAQTLLHAFEHRCPSAVAEMRSILRDAGMRSARLLQLYECLPTLDFSRDILQGAPSALKVVKVPPCGWSDLGTPRRLVEAVSRHRSTVASAPPVVTGLTAFLDLAASHAQRGVAG